MNGDVQPDEQGDDMAGKTSWEGGVAVKYTEVNLTGRIDQLTTKLHMEPSASFRLASADCSNTQTLIAYCRQL